MKTILCLYDFHLILDEAKEIQGYRKILVIDYSRHAEDTVQKYQQDFEIIEVENIFNFEEIQFAVEKYIFNPSIEIAAILPTFEGVVEIAGHLRDIWNIKGMNGKQTSILRDKLLMKYQIQKKGLACANISPVTGIDTLYRFSMKYGFPIVLKPRAGFGAAKTYIINNVSDIPQHGKALEQQDHEWVVESFVKGEEYHCDSIVVGGKVIFTSVGKYHNNTIQTIIDGKMDGTIIFPSDNTEIFQTICQFNQRVMEALEIENSVCHLEVFKTPLNEVFFGEVGARVPGGYIGKCIQNTHGINLYRAFLELELNGCIELLYKTSSTYTGVGIFPSVQGEIIEISTEEELRTIPGIIELKIFNSVGDQINQRRSILDRTGYFIVEGCSYSQVLETIHQVQGRFYLVAR